MKHNETCKMSFGRPSKHSNCPRCEELKAGAKPIQWNTKKAQGYGGSVVGAYCMSLSMFHNVCTKENNPTCACGKRPYCD